MGSSIYFAPSSIFNEAQLVICNLSAVLRRQQEQIGIHHAKVSRSVYFGDGGLIDGLSGLDLPGR